jgi:hypothetical protein
MVSTKNWSISKYELQYFYRIHVKPVWDLDPDLDRWALDADPDLDPAK